MFRVRKIFMDLECYIKNKVFFLLISFTLCGGLK